jgi:hypothetical protein
MVAKLAKGTAILSGVPGFTNKFISVWDIVRSIAHRPELFATIGRIVGSVGMSKI